MHYHAFAALAILASLGASVSPAQTTQNPSAVAQAMSVEQRVAALEQRVFQLEQRQQVSAPSAAVNAPPVNHLATAPSSTMQAPANGAKLVTLQHGTGRMDGKKSIAGGGHAVRFDCGANKYALRAVDIFGSRYGYPQPPADPFVLYVLDQDMKVLQSFQYPYGTFERGPEKWVSFTTTPVDLPPTFYLAVDFKPQQTKGVYVGFEKAAGASHSKSGTPTSGFRDMAEPSDWLIRAQVQPKG